VRREPLTVYIIDDDAAVRDSLVLMLGLAGLRTAAFADAEAFFAAWRPDWAGCVVTDLRLPGASGIELQAALRKRGSQLPVVVITADGDVPSARAAFRAEALDFLEKPFDDAQLRAAIDAAFAREVERLEKEKTRRVDAAKLERLTPREREVLERAAQGLHAKEIAAQLGISPRTVEVHKAHVMEKLGVRNVAELVRFAVAGAGREA
jgi:RNA polymerase sigma factor (sigma-70 family)